MSLTLTYDSVLSRVRLAATGLSLSDAFGRTVSSTWGTSDSGQAWTTSGGLPADFSVSSGVGRLSLGSVGVLRNSLIDVRSPDARVTVDFVNPALPAGAPVSEWVAARAADASNYYTASLSISISNAVTLALFKRVGGTLVGLGSAVSVGSTTSGQAWRVVLDVVGSTLRAKAWRPAFDTEPGWQVTTADTALTTGTQGGVLARLESGNTNTLPHVITVDNFSAVPYVTVERSTDQVRWTTVRGGAGATPTGGALNLDDYEFAPDVPNYYRAAGQVGFGPTPPLNANPYFETDAASWSVAGGTIARSTAQSHEGAASLLLTPDGVSAVAEARNALVPAVAGATLRAPAWVRCAVARTVNIDIDWYTAATAYISTSSQPVAVPANTWTAIEAEFTAPATTAQARVVVGMSGTPAASHLLHIDEALLQAPGITPTIGGVWLKSIARPFLNRQVTVVDYSDVERPSRAGVFDIVGRSFPVAITDVRGSRRWTLEVLTGTAGDAEDVDLLLASGDVLLVQAPASTPVPAGYVVVGDTRQRRTSRLGARRVFELPCTEVAAPAADVVGATSTCQTVLNAYPTCASVLAAHPTCLSLMELIGDPSEVIVP